MRKRCSSWLAHPRWPLFLFALSVAVSVSALDGGLAMDDYIVLGKLRGEVATPPGASPYLELFRFLGWNNADLLRSGEIPWWTDPELKAAFFRPLSAATHVLDDALWGDVIALHHLHSLLWYALCVLLVALLYRRLVASTAAAGLAGLMFALHDSHAMPAAWLSNRNALIAVACGVAALLFHLRWRREGRVGQLALALLALAAGLLAGEAVLGVAAYLVAYQLACDDGSLWRRLLRLWPYALLILGWAALYAALGYGARNSGMYVDPAREPLAFLRALALRLPTLLLALWSKLNSDILLFFSQRVNVVAAVLGAAVTCGVAALFAPLLRARAEARFWALGMILSLVPVCGTTPMDRLLLAPSIGALGLLACLVGEFGWLAPAAAPATVAGGSLHPARRWGLRLLLVLHVGLALPLYLGRLEGFEYLSRRIDENMLAPAGGVRAPQQIFVVLNEFHVGHVYSQVVRKRHGLAVPRFYPMLTSVMTAFEITRPDRRSLIIRPEGGFYAYPGARLFRGGRPFCAGQRLRAGELEVEVLSVTEDGRPRAARFTFAVPLEHASLRWYYVKDARLQPFSMLRVGETRTIPRGLPI